jgi:hypothetical protein
MIRISISVALISILLACGQKSASNNDQGTDSTQSALPISLFRDSVASKPVASFRKKTPNDLNDWYFSVDLFETNKRFEYVVKMQYEEAGGEDTISFPNLGIEPKPALRQGKNNYSCIIGFFDNQGAFREYKEVSYANNQLRITTLKYYAVTVSEK